MPKLNEEFITIQASIVRETERAMLIEYHGENIWIPISQVEGVDADFLPPKITLTAWIAKEKGII